MAKMNLDYYSGEDFYSDGDVEERILQIVENKEEWREYAADQELFTYAYHLSKVRENILNWYPFKENASVLEIGAGCGALTGLLCERAEVVVACELSKRRAKINYLRHENCENLEIMVGNLNEMKIERKFDYVILNGVFEYAMSFTKGNKPYETFLNSVCSYLKPDGVLLLAIENRLGIKYFAGSAEDHTDTYFLGLNGYEGNEDVRTFSKTELIELLEHCALPHYRFYYPYPDYKWTYEIFTDETLATHSYGKAMFSVEKDRFEFFNKEQMCQTLIKEQVMDTFANSFLVEASKKELTPRKVVYAKLNSDRNEEFQIATVIEQGKRKKVVKKYALSKKAEAHIAHMKEAWGKKKQGAYNMLPVKKATEKNIEFQFLAAKTLNAVIKEYVEEGDKTSILETLKNAYEVLFQGKMQVTSIESEAFQKVFGETKLERKEYLCVNPANIDLICDNIFLIGKHYEVIDYEWVFNFAVPIDFIFWRTLNELYTKHSALEALISRTELYSYFGIDKMMDTVFWKWANHFAKEYVGSYQMEKFHKPAIPYSLNQTIDALHTKQMLRSSLYIDYGNGFSEEEKIYKESFLEEKRFTVRYELASGACIRNLRWDPVELPCYCKITSCMSDEQMLDIHPQNGEQTEDGKTLFLTNDPRYSVTFKPNMTSIEISGELEILDSLEVTDLAEKILASSKEQVARLLMEQKKEDALQSTIYLDFGAGYSEETRVYASKEDRRNHLLVHFELPDDRMITKLRWDPVETSCLCTIKSMKSNASDLWLEPLNSKGKKQDADVFLTNDPIYEIHTKEEVRWLTIEADIQPVCPEYKLEKGESYESE